MIVKDFKKIPIMEATKIPTTHGQYNLIANMYWCVTEDDCILYYKNWSRQCNGDINICKHLMEYEDHPGVKVVFLSCVWEKISNRDYL